MDTYSQFRKCVAIGIIILFIGVSTIPFIHAQNLQLESNTETNDIIVDNEGDGDYTSIQDAIDNASNGDKIMVYSGIYHENVLVNKTLTLVGVDAELGAGNDTGMPILNGTGVGGTGIMIKADGTLIKGFFIRDYQDGIDLVFCRNNMIVNNTIVLPKNAGNYIGLYVSDYNTISYNQLLGQGKKSSIYLDGSWYNKIVSNDFQAFLPISLFNSVHNIWFNNYYYRDWLHGLPHVIPGLLMLTIPNIPFLIFMPYIDIELFPARHPHFS
jgi:parallel beta-helix repeat protein